MKQKMATSVVTNYLKKTDDPEKIFSAILKFGFEDPEVTLNANKDY